MSIARCAVLVLLAATMISAQSSAAKPAKKPAGGSDLQAILEKLEKQGWDAYKTHDTAAFRQLCVPEYTSVEADQGPVRDLQATLDAMKNFEVDSYSFNEVKATPLGPEAALLTYTAKVNLKVEGKPQDITLGVTDVYVKRGGQWKALRYHESQIH